MPTTITTGVVVDPGSFVAVGSGKRVNVFDSVTNIEDTVTEGKAIVLPSTTVTHVGSSGTTTVSDGASSVSAGGIRPVGPGLFAGGMTSPLGPVQL